MRRPRWLPRTIGTGELDAVRRDRFDYAPCNVDGLTADFRKISSRYWLLGLFTPALFGQGCKVAWPLFSS